MFDQERRNRDLYEGAIAQDLRRATIGDSKI